MLGPRTMGTGAGPHSGYPATGRGHDPSQEDYFNLGNTRPPFSGHPTGDRGRGGADLEHRTSAKKLIDSYERLNTPPPPSGDSNSSRRHASALARNKSTYSTQYVYDYRDKEGAGAGSRYLQTPEKKGFGASSAKKDKDKDRSPIRQSLRNLFSAFKKGAGGLTRKKSDERLGVGGAPYGHCSEPTNGSARHGHGSLQGQMQPPEPAGRDQASTGAAPVDHQQQQQQEIPARPRKKMTGSLLYLTRIDPSAELTPLPSPIDISLSTCSANPDIGDLAWTTCTVTLDGTKLVLSSFTSELQLVVHEILLAGCVDIRSLSATQLSTEEARLLRKAGVRTEGEKGGLKVFEISFKGGRPKEKFAAKSVRERAGWISAVWDAILPDKDAQKAHIPTDMDATNFNASADSTSTKPKPIESPIPKPIPQMSAILSPSYSDRSLPPVPPEKSTPPPVAPLSIPEKELGKKHPNLHLDIPPLNGPISPSIYPDTSCASSPSGTPGSQSQVSSSQPTSPSTIRGPISPSTYPATSRPASVFGISPTNSCPNSPSIANLSQLSMVRQRLAQIERNHSNISRQSGSGFSDLTRPSTPTTPVRTPGGGGCIRTSGLPTSPGGWSRREMIFHNATPRSSPLSSPTRGMSPVLVPPTRRMTIRGESSKTPTPEADADVPRKSKVHREHETKDLPRTQVPIDGEILDLTKDVADIKGVIGGESGCPTIHQVVVGLDHRIQKDGKTLKTIHMKVDQLGERFSNAIAATSASSVKDASSSLKDQEVVLRAIEEIKTRLEAGFPSLSSKIQEIRFSQEEDSRERKEKGQEVVCNNLAPSSAASSTNEVKTVDLQPVLDKLEGFKALLEATKNAESTRGEKDDLNAPEHMEKILAVIQEESNKQTLLSQQQADSVRYLNELNTWLEAFVNNGTSQIQGLSAGVEQLCRSLGCNPQIPGAPLDNAPNLLSDIRQLVMGMQARDHNFEALQAAVRSLLEVLTMSQARMGADSQAIAGLIDQQRRDQETLFRTFTNEISGEIKGERLRFVEAMKEATAINVQIHVEQFKQELSREVLTMTEEVGRLHREKQHMENQISDLFAFYSKHKQEPLVQATQNLEPATPMPAQNNERHGTERRRVNIPRSHHRPLPYPG